MNTLTAPLPLSLRLDAQVARRPAPGHLSVMSSPSRPSRMPTPDELSAWIRAVADPGDRAAFAALFRHFAPRIKAFLMRGGADAALAEELAQEAMVNVWRKAASFDPARAQASTWVFTIARNLRIDYARRGLDGAREQSAGDAADELTDELADAAPTPPEQLAAGQIEHGVREALGKLPEDQALLLRLSFYEEQPHADIAKALSIPLGTVKSRIRRAMEQLRRALGHLQP
ncbi:MAG: sigma-70 family RNA polymerase sigma factor [Rhodocyclaceae bacterium]|nr:sigma-70 family RNA polymerase sigma factor [Rhodocyclaceae bacterium]MBX3669652.1 sigma-70 family RNA polymerase sigma factor [Rhodocyclaceae bacterium]